MRSDEDQNQSGGGRKGCRGVIGIIADVVCLLADSDEWRWQGYGVWVKRFSSIRVLLILGMRMSLGWIIMVGVLCVLFCVLLVRDCCRDEMSNVNRVLRKLCKVEDGSI